MSLQFVEKFRIMQEKLIKHFGYLWKLLKTLILFHLASSHLSQHPEDVIITFQGLNWTHCSRGPHHAVTFRWLMVTWSDSQDSVEGNNRIIKSKCFHFLLEDKWSFWKQKRTVSRGTTKPEFSRVSRVGGPGLLHFECGVIKLVVVAVFEEVSPAIRVLHCSLEIVRNASPVTAVVN